MIVVMPSAVVETWTAFGSWSSEAIEVEARLVLRDSGRCEDSSEILQWFANPRPKDKGNHSSTKMI